jgi:hypothetical protein
MSGKMIEIGSLIKRHSRGGLLAVVAVAGLSLLRPATASAQLLESFEGGMDGWTFTPQAGYTASVGATGATDGTSALGVGATYQGSKAGWTTTAGLNFGPTLTSPANVSWTATLSGASSIKIDIDTPAGTVGADGDLGFFVAVDLDVSAGPAFGFQSIDPAGPFNYPDVYSGGELTETYPLTPAQDAELASDAAGGFGTFFQIQIGSSFSNDPSPDANNAVYLDNIRATPVPEPVSCGLLAVGATGLMMRRRRA